METDADGTDEYMYDDPTTDGFHPFEAQDVPCPGCGSITEEHPFTCLFGAMFPDLTNERESPETMSIEINNTPPGMTRREAESYPAGTVFVLPDGKRTIIHNGSISADGPFRCLFNPEVDNMERILTFSESNLLDILDREGIHVPDATKFKVLDALNGGGAFPS